MKIIKQGTPPSSKKKTFNGECPTCGAIVEAEQWEVIQTGPTYSVKCPTEDCPDVITMTEGKFKKGD